MTLDEYLENSTNYKSQYYKKHILVSEEERYSYEKSKIKKESDKLLKKEASLLASLVKQNDPDVYFSVYYYLLWNGYLSTGNDFIFKSKKKEIDANLAINIACGAGCCRNIAVHFTNLMHQLDGKNNYILVGTRYKNSPKKIEDTDKIKQQIDKNYSNCDETKNIYLPNHMESYYLPKKTIYDPTGFNIQKVSYDSIGKENFIGIFDLGYESIYSQKESLEEKLSTLNKRLKTSELLVYAKKENLSKEKLIKLREMGIAICEENKDLIEEYREENNHNYEYIKKVMNNYR